VGREVLLAERVEVRDEVPELAVRVHEVGRGLLQAIRRARGPRLRSHVEAREEQRPLRRHARGRAEVLLVEALQVVGVGARDEVDARQAVPLDKEGARAWRRWRGGATSTRIGERAALRSSLEKN
jgi:hypothetical protein